MSLNFTNNLPTFSLLWFLFSGGCRGINGRQDISTNDPNDIRCERSLLKRFTLGHKLVTYILSGQENRTYNLNIAFLYHDKLL